MDHRFDKINKWIQFALIYFTLNQLELILFIIVGANCLEGNIKTVWIGPMAQSKDIN